MQNNRAKQFLPFDSLKGFRDTLKLIENNYELKNEENLIINKLKNIKIGTRILVEYFYSEKYLATIGILRDINYLKKYIILSNTYIYFSEIVKISVN